MWNKFNIKIQLTIFMVVIICVVELSTLYFVNQYQKKENKKNALMEVDTITKSLNNDLIKKETMFFELYDQKFTCFFCRKSKI